MNWPFRRQSPAERPSENADPSRRQLDRPYYHLCPVELRAKSVILPGNWGRIIKRAGWAHNLAMREVALEYARQAQPSYLPSRLECAFAFLTSEEARLFWVEERKGSVFDVLYRVSLADPKEVTFVTDWTLVAPAGDVGSGWADRYWSQPARVESHGPSPIGGIMQVAGQRREVLTMSPLVIEERLDLR